MTWKDELKNNSKIEIDIRTKFKKQLYKSKDWDDEDLTKEIEEGFHDAIHTWIEKQITDNEDFEQEILEIMTDEENLIEGTDEFSKLGNISISISQIHRDINKELEDKQEQLMFP